MATENHAVLLNPQLFRPFCFTIVMFVLLYLMNRQGILACVCTFILEMLHYVCSKYDVLDFVRLVLGSASFIGFRTTFIVKETYFLL